MDIHEKSHHRNMTSQEWQKQIDDTAAEITAKETRLAAIASAKATVIVTTDTKKLLALEQEEMGLPATIESLRRRLPLLNQAHEGALRAEAEERYREIEQQGAEAAARCAASTQAIRGAMQELLDRITAAHADSNAHGLLAAEGEYLRVRFGLAPLRLAPGERISAEERARFVRQCENLLRQAPNTQPWSRMRAEFQEAERRKEEQRRRDEAAALPQIPIHIHYQDTARRTEEPRQVEAEALPPTRYIHYRDHAA